MIKPNLRIQLFTEEGGMVSERMVAQLPEFYNGPKDKHKGPMRIEFTFNERSDVESAMDYLKRLALDLPIKTVKGVQGRKAKELDNDAGSDETKETIITRIFESAEDQDDFIKKLRDIGFYFVVSDYLPHIIPEAYNIKERHLERYQWLIRRTKEAKDPKNDKYDPQILVGLQIMDDRHNKVVIYLYGELHTSWNIPVPSKKAINAKKTNLIKYPHYMTEDERFKWGTEHRLLHTTIKSGKERKPSKFYLRWFKDVKVGDELYINPIELGLDN